MTYQTKLRPWCIVHQLPEMQRVVVERFRRYHDADAHLKVLRKLSPRNSFVVLFDPDSEVSVNAQKAQASQGNAVLAAPLP